MDGHNLVAVYSSRADAERVQDRLIAFGIPATGIRLSSASADTGAAAITESPHERHHSFWDWLFGDDVPEHDRGWYHTNLREGRTALSVLVRSDAEHEQVFEIMEEFNPVHMDDGTETGAGRSAWAQSKASTLARAPVRCKLERRVLRQRASRSSQL